MGIKQNNVITEQIDDKVTFVAEDFKFTFVSIGNNEPITLALNGLNDEFPIVLG